MSETVKHTPGPWEVDAHGSPVIYGQSLKGRMRVADIRGWGHLTGGGHGALGLADNEAIAIQEANGRLIAAAPEMYEALGAAENELEWQIERGAGTDVTRAALRIVKAARAKAEAPSQDAA